MLYSRLKYCREKLEMTQSTYSHYEIGYKLITTLNLYTICKTYNVSMDFLMNRTDNIFLKDNDKSSVKI